MKDREQGRRTQFTAVAEKKHAPTMGIEEKKGEEEEGIFFVGSPAASGASPSRRGCRSSLEGRKKG